MVQQQKRDNMKGTYKKIRIGLVAALMPLALSLTFTSCSQESEMEVVKTGDKVSVRIGVKADSMTDLGSTRSYNEDYNAEEGEFIHSLCIFVINVDYEDEYSQNVTGFTLEAKIEPDLKDDPDAQKGNLASWYSFFDITAGDKILLAFANWEYVVNTEDENDGWAKLLSMKEGDSFDATSFDGLTAELSILVDDPASKVDIANGQYIPMSGIEEVYFWHYGDLDVGYIPLERLVAKVTLAGQIVDYTEDVDNYAENAVTYTCTSGTLSNTNDKVWLFHYYYDDFYFADETYPTSATDYDGTASLSLVTNPTISINGGTVNLGTFYVNETVLTQYASHFSLQWDLSSTDTERQNLKFGANTNAGVLQRNSVLPLVFSWDYDYTGVVVNAWVELTGEEIYYDPSNQSGGNIY